MRRQLVFAIPLAALSGLSALAADADQRQREAAAKETASAFVKELGAALAQEMGKGGPAAAVRVCTTVAPEIAGRLSRERGWRVTRVSEKVRNPLLGMPDAWEQKVLAQFKQQAGQGERLDTMSFSELVKEPDGNYFRFMKAIPVQPVCLVCHGRDDQIAPAIREVLKQNYPHDKAVGYRAGELRVAISIKQPLGIAD
jgi:hypothetical protein